MQTITPHAYADSEGLRAMQESELKACREAFGELHPKTLVAKNNLGVTLRHQGCLPQSRKLLESALKDCRHVRGKNHPDTMRAMNNLAMALNDDGDAARAHELLTEVVAWRRREFGESHPTTIDAMINLSGTLGALDAHEEEHALDLAVFKLRQRDLGEDHPKTIEALGNLGMSQNNVAVDFRKKGNLEDAEPLQWNALAMVEKAFGTHDPITACVYSSIGMLLKLKGDMEQAIVYFHKALEIREKKLGLDAELTQLVRTRLREMLH